MPDSQGYVRSGGDIHTDGHTSAGEREDHVRGGRKEMEGTRARN